VKIYADRREPDDLEITDDSGVRSPCPVNTGERLNGLINGRIKHEASGLLQWLSGIFFPCRLP
jgi:hypothetical protein